jgi:hypothetical protein
MELTKLMEAAKKGGPLEHAGLRGRLGDLGNLLALLPDTHSFNPYPTSYLLPANPYPLTRTLTPLPLLPTIYPLTLTLGTCWSKRPSRRSS